MDCETRPLFLLSRGVKEGATGMGEGGGGGGDGGRGCGALWCRNKRLDYSTIQDSAWLGLSVVAVSFHEEKVFTTQKMF